MALEITDKIMKQIKFRGKLKQSEYVYGTQLPKGTWVYGYYSVYMDSHRIILPNQQASQLALDVEPETVGQFTGFTDINNKEIFEGDILCWGMSKDDEFVVHATDNPAVIVKWLNGGFKFVDTRDFDFNDNDASQAYTGNHYKVIGNIYDTPEKVGSTKAV